MWVPMVLFLVTRRGLHSRFVQLTPCRCTCCWVSAGVSPGRQDAYLAGERLRACGGVSAWIDATGLMRQPPPSLAQPSPARDGTLKTPGEHDQSDGFPHPPPPPPPMDSPKTVTSASEDPSAVVLSRKVKVINGARRWWPMITFFRL